MRVYLYLDNSVSFSDERPFAVYRYTFAESREAAYAEISSVFGSFCSMVDVFDTVEDMHRAYPGSVLFCTRPITSPENADDIHDFIVSCKDSTRGRPSKGRKNRIQIRCTDAELSYIYDFINDDSNDFKTITDVLIGCMKTQHSVEFHVRENYYSC